jgi:hypothetical protein
MPLRRTGQRNSHSDFFFSALQRIKTMSVNKAPFFLPKVLVIPALGIFVLTRAEAQSSGNTCPPPPMLPEQQMAYIEKMPAKNAGFLWQVEKDGRTSWLYGTMHLNHIDYAKPGPQIMTRVRNSDVLAVEINPYEPQTLPASMQLPQFQLSSSQLDKLSKAYAKECLVFNATNVSSLPSTVPLVNSQAQRQSLFWGYSPDARLAQIAKRMSKTIVPLETLAQHITALAPESQLEFDSAFESVLTAFESGKIQTELVQLNKAWQQNDWQVIVQLEQEMTANQPAFSARLLDQRNVLMAQKIDRLHQDGKRVFVAVGALHMAGKTALPKLLQGKGYAVAFIPLRD